MPDSRALWWFALVATSAAFAGRALADDSREWLERMNAALMNRTYVGDFFHVQDGRVEALRILHRVERGEVRERLVSLDGSGREFIRTGTELACYLPDKSTVLVERRPTEGPLLGALPAFDRSTADYYDYRSLEPARLMGRATRVIAVTPRDQYRYGYRLWIDESTAMPLKTQLCDDRGNVIEQIVFAHLTLPDRIPDADFVPHISTRGFRWLRHSAHEDANAGSVAAAVGLWVAPRLPPGFHLTARSTQPMPGSAGPVAHLVFSDGLASVSVFVESAEAPENERGEATSRVGSASAYSTIVDGHQVTAVGEVPPETVRYIASSVRAELPGAGELSGARPGDNPDRSSATLGTADLGAPGAFGSPERDLGPGANGFGTSPASGPGTLSSSGGLSLYPGR
jgi:sigma-E factor negative regulatory protein RseB